MNVSKKSSVFSIIQHLNDLTCILLKLCRKEKPGLNIGEIRSNHWTKWIQSKKKVAVEVYLSTFTSLTETVQILFNVVIQLCHLLPDKKTLVVVPGQGQWHHSISTQYLVAYRYQTRRGSMPGFAECQSSYFPKCCCAVSILGTQYTSIYII